MKKRFSIAVLLTIILGLLPSTMAYSQTYSISPSGYTEKPTYQSLSNSWIGYTTGSNSIWIETKAEKSGSSVVFYVRKSSGTFQNSVSYKIRRDVEVSGSKVTSEGTQVGSGSISAGKSSGSCTITPTSGSHEYRVILTSGSMTFYSRIVKITVEAASPTKPSSPTPSNGATNVATSGTFSWSTSPNDGGSSISYDLYLDTKSDFSSSGRLYNSGQGKSCSYSNLKPGTKYYWKVIVYNSSGKSIWSDAWSFTTKDAASPTKPSSPTPSNGATNVATSGTFSWSTSPNDGGSSISYDLYLDTKSDFSSSGRLYNSGQGKSCSYSNLKPGTKYYWKVIVYNSSGKSIWSDAWSFTTKDAASPTKPSSPTPSNGATNVATSGTFSWSTSPNDGGSSISYDLYLDTKSDFSSSGRLYNSGQGKSCSYSGLKANTKYYWKVIVYNSSGKSIWSDAWSFTTKSDEVATPTKPSSPSPSNGGTNVSTSGTFSWSTSPNDGGSSISYDLYLDTKSDFSSSGRLYNSGQGKSCSYSGLKANTKYYWKVIVYNGSGGHIWSDAWSFTTKSDEVSAPTKPSSPTPSNGISGVATSGTFKWGASANDGGSTLNYDLYIDTSSSFANVSKPYKSGKGTSCTYAGLKAGTKHYWKVIVYNGSGKSTWSDVWSFTTAAATTSFGAPAFNTISAYGITSSGATVSWGDVVNATSYDVQISNTSNFGKIIDTGYGKPGRTYYSSTNLQASTTYYVRIRAKNSSQTSSWTNTYTFKTTAAKTNDELTEPAELYLYDRHGFGTASLIVNQSKHFVTCIENRENATWIGHVYLKNGDELIKPWYDVTISKHGAKYLEFDYVPETTGAKTLTLYYQTGKHGRGREVNKGSFNNPIVVQVKDNFLTKRDLKLNASISFSSQDIEVEKPVNVSVNIFNGESSDWKGSLILKDNDLVIGSSSLTIPGRTTKALSFVWKPLKKDSHNISIYYRNSGEEESQIVQNNGYSNPIVVNVKEVPVVTKASSANLIPLTKELAPSEVNEGSIIHYFYKVTDKNNNPLPNMLAIFECSGSSASGKQLQTSWSGNDGIVDLRIETEGENAIGKRGEKARLTCVGLSHMTDGNVELRNANSADHVFDIKVHKGFAGGLFERLESVDFTVDLGVGAEIAPDSPVSGSVELSTPITLGLEWNDDGSIKKFNLEAEAKIEGEIKAEGKWASQDVSWFKQVDLGACLGVFAGAKYKISTPTAKDAAFELIMKLCDSYDNGTSKRRDFAVKTLRSWYYSDHQRDVEEKASLYVGGKFGFNGGLQFLKNVPKNKGSVKKTRNLPLNRFKEFSVSGDASFKWEPYIVKTSSKDKTIQYGEGMSLNFKGKITGEKTGLNLKKMFGNKSWWKSSGMSDFYDKKLKDFYNYETLKGGVNGSLSISEQEMYNSDSKIGLEEISHEMSVSTGYEIESKNFQLFKTWSPINASFNYSSTSSMKMSSKGGWASYLQNVYNNDKNNKEKLWVKKVFPAFDGQTMISSPDAIYSVWENDIEEPLMCLADEVENAKQYNLADALKVDYTNSTSIGGSVNITFLDWPLLKLAFDLGLTIETKSKPCTSYYSVENKRFFPIIMQPATSISDIVESVIQKMGNNIANAFSDDEKSQIEEKAKDFYSYREYDPQTGKTIEMTYDKDSRNWIYKEYIYAARAASRSVAKYTRMAEASHDDICTLGFTVNDGINNFETGTTLKFAHYYPAGDLFAVTDKNDTLFVVSDVADITAIKDGIALNKTSNGTFRLNSHVGVDDLTPFGLPEDLELDIYRSEENSDIWHYVGPAGSPIDVADLGSYILATPIKNDVINPTITLDYDSDSGIIYLNVDDNIGIRTRSIKAMINGETKELNPINSNSYEIQLSEEDVEYRLNIYASVYDIAGNKSEISQIFNLDKPEKIRIEDLPDTDVSLLENTIYVDPVTAKTGGEVTLSVKMKNSVQAEGFQFDLELPEGVTVAKDADGFPEAYLSTARTTSRKTNYFDSSFLENGALRVVAGSTNGSAIDGNDGEVVTIKLNVAKNVPAGSYPILIRNIAISDTNSDSHNVAYVKSTMTVSSGVLGDASGNGTVGPEDITAVVRYIMEGYYDGFNFNNADLNGDDNVDAADLVRLIKMVNP